MASTRRLYSAGPSSSCNPSPASPPPVPPSFNLEIKKCAHFGTLKRTHASSTQQPPSKRAKNNIVLAINSDSTVPTPTKLPVFGDTPNARDDSEIQYEDDVWLEKKGEGLIIHFKCPCSDYEIFRTENNAKKVNEVEIQDPIIVDKTIIGPITYQEPKDKPFPAFPVLFTHGDMSSSYELFLPHYGNQHFQLECPLVGEYNLIGCSTDGKWGLFRAGFQLKVFNGFEEIYLPNLPSGEDTVKSVAFSPVNDELVVVVVEQSEEDTLVHRIEGSMTMYINLGIKSVNCMGHVRIHNDMIWFDVSRGLLVQLKNIFVDKHNWFIKESPLQEELFAESRMVCSVLDGGRLLALVRKKDGNFVIGRVYLSHDEVRPAQEYVYTGVNLYVVGFQKGFTKQTRPGQEVEIYVAGLDGNDCQKFNLDGQSEVLKLCESPDDGHCGCGHSWLQFGQ